MRSHKGSKAWFPPMCSRAGTSPPRLTRTPAPRCRRPAGGPAPSQACAGGSGRSPRPRSPERPPRPPPARAPAYAGPGVQPVGDAGVQGDPVQRRGAVLVLRVVTLHRQHPPLQGGQRPESSTQPEPPSLGGLSEGLGCPSHVHLDHPAQAALRSYPKAPVTLSVRGRD